MKNKIFNEFNGKIIHDIEVISSGCIIFHFTDDKSKLDSLQINSQSSLEFTLKKQDQSKIEFSALERKELRLNWEYCECGCKGHEIPLEGFYFWLFNDLKGKFYLHKGHGWTGTKIGIFSSFTEADDFVANMIEEKIENMKKLIKPKSL